MITEEGERYVTYTKWDKQMWEVHRTTLKNNWHDFEEHERRKLLADMVAHAPEVMENE